MSFWSKFFSFDDTSNHDSNNQKKSATAKPKESSISSPEPYKNGWYRLSNGVLFKNDPNFNGTLNEIYARHISELGYNGGELYPKDNLSINPMIIGYFTLFENRLIAICRNSNDSTPIMSLYDIKRFVSEYGDIFEWEEENNITEGIKNHSISQGFVESICKSKAINNSLSNGKYVLSFQDGFLVSFKSADGLTSEARDILDTAAYFKEATAWHRGNKDLIASEINLHAHCAARIDLSIIRSTDTKIRFSYPNGHTNYIALATHFKVCDILLNEFIDSTHGRYEVLSNDYHNGIKTTKIKAYGVVFTFYDGHSLQENIPNKSLVSDKNEEDGNGFVYIMINPSMPEIVKIGQTTRDPNERAKELSASTGVPTPFVVVFYKPFNNCITAEKVIHGYLQEQGYRVSDNREFFYIPVNDAINVVQAYYNLENQNSMDSLI